MPCQVPSARAPFMSGMLIWVGVRAARMWAGMSSGPSTVCRYHFAFFGREAFEEFVEIADDIRIGIFLDGQRRRSVLDENGEESVAQALFLGPVFNLGGDGVQALAARSDVHAVGELLHSTVTLLARSRG